MILPDRVFWTAEENVLSGSRLRVFFLDLYLAHHAGMLYDFRDVRLMLAPYLTSNALQQVNVASIHPVLPEYSDGSRSNADTVRCEIGLNHAEGTVDGPEYEEYDKHVMCVPESFEVGSACFLYRCNHHAHECNQHDIT